jgi:hypothetical protein
VRLCVSPNLSYLFAFHSGLRFLWRSVWY